MGGLGSAAILLSSCLSIYLVSTLFEFLHKLWWKPIRLQHLMRSQGITGPSYSFIYGNSKEIIQMRSESVKKPVQGLSHHNMYSRLQPHIHSWIKNYGSNLLYWVGPRPQVLVSEPGLVKEILNDKDKIYVKGESQTQIKKLLGDGIVVAEGEKWAKMRKLANYAFHGESLKNMVPAMIASTEMMLERWKNHQGNEIDVYHEFKILTSEVISRTAFGSSYLEGEAIFDKISKLTVAINKFAFKTRLPIISKIFKTRDETDADKLEKETADSILQLIKKREQKMMTGEAESYGDDFLGLLLKASHDDNNSKRISVQNVIDECKTFYVAGHETTHALLSWAVMLLAIHKDWQEEARKEVFECLGREIPTADGTAKMKIMGMIINEALRLYPPAAGVIREAKREVRLGGNLTVPTNVNLHVSTLALHYDPNVWGEDVNLFKPERFSEGVAKATNNNTSAFMPFGLGPRTCVGSNFAITEAKIVLSMILQRYSFTLSPAYVHSPVQVILIRPQHGIQVILKALQSEC